jgi:hypothetical protein
MNTEMQAIQIAKSLVTEGFTVSYMNSKEVEDFIWGYLYDNGLQYKVPIEYVDTYGNKCSAIIYQNN